MGKLSRVVVPAALSAALACAAPADAATIAVTDDPVLYWNQIALDTLTPAANIRVNAMMNIAMHDAVNATLGYPDAPYLNGVLSPGGDVRAAAAQAARDVLVQVNPAGAAQYDAALSASLALVPDAGARANGVLTGQAYAAAIVANRANDGAFAPASYTPSGLPGRWEPTPPAFAAAQFPQWADVTPFLMSSPSQFRPGPPPALDSAAYAAAVNEVKGLGAATGSTRTQDQTDSALFWNPANSSTWLRIGLDLSADEGRSTIDNARLFALLSAGTADALITGWNTKYFYDLWRPVTAIREADTDGNPLTIADPNWTPLNAAPPHQSYLSTLSALSAMTSTILLETIGDESFCATVGLNTRCWSGLEAAAQDAAISRTYGGIHYRFDGEAGLAAGERVARLALDGLVLNAVPEPGAWGLMIAGFGLMGFTLRRLGRADAKRAAPECGAALS